jgi:proteasome accessory factor A
MAVPKFVARDCELSTTGVDAQQNPIDSWKVTSLVLQEIPNAFGQSGREVWTRDSYANANSMDCRRNWVANGQCYYSDMSHVEVCTAETTSPRAFAAQCISTLLAVETARALAEDHANEDVRLSLAATNADVLDPSISWGTHLNVSVSSALWEDLFRHHRHPATLGFVSSALAAGIAFFGSGYLLPLKDGITYSLSARAHHLSQVHTQSTTEAFHRGLLNSRREPHGEGHERLHLIGFDYTIIGAALLCSFVQCLLAAAEEGYCGLILYDPVRALRQWSWNLDLRTGRLPAEAVLIDGRNVTLPVYVRELVERLLAMCDSGLITSKAAPEATEMLPKIIEMTRYAEEGSINRCASHLDWAAKLLYLYGNKRSFDDPRSRLADHDFANTNCRKGAIWRLWERELIDPLIKKEDAEAALNEAPPESRAWGRGQLIQRFSDEISDINWSYVDLYRGGGRWGRRLRIDTPHLDRMNRVEFEPIIKTVRDLDHLEDLLEDDECDDRDPLENVTEHLATPASR